MTHRRMFAVPFLVCCMLSSSLALAQGGHAPGQVPPTGAVPDVHHTDVELTPTLAYEPPPRFSEKKARILSIAGTLAAPVLLFASASLLESDVPGGVWVGAGGYTTGLVLVFIGPSLGHFYTKDKKRFRRDSLWRLGSFALFGIGLIFDSNGGGDFSTIAMAGGAASFIGFTAYSIYDAPRSARRGNRRSLGISPRAFRDINGKLATGISLNATF